MNCGATRSAAGRSSQSDTEPVPTFSCGMSRISRCSLFFRGFSDAPVSRPGVLCGAVSSHARRWGALARPNGGLLLRVPLRGHRASFPVRYLVKLVLPAALVLAGLLGACTQAPSKNEAVLTFSCSAP